MENFNKYAYKMLVTADSINQASRTLQKHEVGGRMRERDNPISNRDVYLQKIPKLPFKDLLMRDFDFAADTFSCPMDAIDQTFLAFINANPGLRPRVGNPDEIRSNHLNATLDQLKHRVTETELGIAEALNGAVITA